MNMPAFLDITIPLMTFLIMFSVGTGLELNDLNRVSKSPKKVVLASLAQIACLPLIGLLVVNLLSLSDYIVAGVLLIAACPGGSISNFYIYLARANVALSVVLTGISCLLAVITMPLVMSVFMHYMSVPETFHVPIGKLVHTLIWFLLVPIILGMLLRHLRPSLVARIDPWLRIGSMLFLGALIIQVIWQSPEVFTINLTETVKASVAMAGLAILAGLLVGRMMKLEAYDYLPVVIELMVQNVALASTIAVTVFHQARFASFATAYFLAQVPIAAVLIIVFLRSQGTKPAKNVRFIPQR